MLVSTSSTGWGRLLIGHMSQQVHVDRMRPQELPLPRRMPEPVLPADGTFATLSVRTPRSHLSNVKACAAAGQCAEEHSLRRLVHLPGNKGQGLLADEDIQPGTLIAEYLGAAHPLHVPAQRQL